MKIEGLIDGSGRKEEGGRWEEGEGDKLEGEGEGLIKDSAMS